MFSLLVMSDTFDDLMSKAIELCGGSETKLAKACGVSQNTVWAARRAKRVSAELAVKIGTATDSAVPRWKLRPDLWEAPASTVAE